MSAQQRQAALIRANLVRLGRAGIKREIRGGMIGVADALDANCCQGMRVYDLLIAQRGWGRRRVLKHLSNLSMVEGKTVATLTDRQRQVLAESLPPMPYRRVA